MTTQKQLLVVVGPTATGKTALALRLALELDGEVVSADSRQVYRYMDIGTAKPTVQQQATVPHHLIDVVDPDAEYNLALFLRQARTAVADVQSRSKLPILVGGSGQYVWGLLEGWRVPGAPPDADLRKALTARVSKTGVGELYEELARLDPDAAKRVDPRNPRRVIRALELYYSSQAGAAPTPSRRLPPFRSVILGLTLERAALYTRVNCRVEEMVQAGWVREVQRLLERGYSPDLPSMSSLGYNEIGQYLKGEMALEDAVASIKQRTRRFARQQYAWFRLSDERIRWFHGTKAGLDEAVADACKVLSHQFQTLESHARTTTPVVLQ